MAYFLELYKQLTTSGEGRTPVKNKARSADAKDPAKASPRKKKDALEGKDQKKHNSDERDGQKGREASKEGKGGSGEGGGHQSSQNLQSGQTTVQFSSGGGLASLGSLMALFGSSASLARAMTGSAMNATQANTLSGRSGFQDPGARQESLGNQDAKNLKETVSAIGGTSESTGGKLNLETASISLARNTSSAENTLASLLKNVGMAANATDTANASSPITLFNAGLGGFVYTSTFNSNSFFFSPQIIFAFPNSQPTGAVLPNGAQALSPYVGEISNILNLAGLPTASTYSYQVVSPLSVFSSTSNLPSTGIAVTPGSTALSVNVDMAPAFPVTTAPAGLTISTLTISASGDLYVNVQHPLSVIVNVQTSPTSTPFPIRLDVGPGQVVTDVKNDIMMGSAITADPSAGISVVYNSSPNNMTGSSVFRDVSSTGYTLIGNGAALDISDSGFVMTLNPDATLSSKFTLPSSGFYAFPENTLYRHIGTSEATLPVAATYGNFMSLPTADNIIRLPGFPSSYTLQLGGNVLDVYGTKYGVADNLVVTLPVLDPLYQGPLPTNIIKLGGNTLAGFGTSYGDLQTLTLSAQSGTSAAASGTTPPILDLIFRGNVLAVDKGIGSVLYPHLQTLDMENAVTPASPSSPAGSSAPANVQISFQNSIIQGNQGNDTFYGDIQNLGNNSNPQAYNGFLTGVFLSVNAGHIMATTADGNENSITWGNTIYSGGGQNPDTPTIIASDAYNFTLLEDAATKNAAMQGHALLTDFNPVTDTLTLQISPDLFRALDGAAGQGHIKQITLDDLELGTSFSSASSATAALLDPDFAAYLSQIDPHHTLLTGTTLTFDMSSGGAGGSITFLNGAQSGAQHIDFRSFSDIPNFDPNVNLVVSFTYAPVAALAVGEIIASTPTQTAPFLYGEGPNNNIVTRLYYNELDYFFAHSLFATYSVAAPAGTGITATPFHLLPSNALPGTVAIDPFGTISVQNTVPFFAPLTITATDQQGHTATTTQTFGFLDAPITVYPDAPLTPGQPPITVVGLLNTPNIISGGKNLEIVGQFFPTFNQPLTGGTSTVNSSITFDSSLIVDTAGNATAYGDFKAVNLNALGVNDLTASSSNRVVDRPTNFIWDGNPGTPGDPSDPVYTGHTFNTNAIYVTDGVSYGVTKDFNITVAGGSRAAVQFGPQFTSVDLDGSATFENNRITFQPQTLYGTGTLYGMMDQLSITITGGSVPTLTLPAGLGNVSGDINVSASVIGNTFSFSPASAGFPTTITVQGDTSPTQITTVYGNVNTLLITTDTPAFKVTTTLDINTTATFANNQFIFGDEVLKGGVGSTVFYGHLYKFGDTFKPNVHYYNGLVNGVTVDPIQSQQHVLTITDARGNSITWGNNTYTGGEGHNTYNFTIVEDNNGYAIMQGFDTITNFDPTTDTLVFNVQANLYARLGMSPTDSAAVLLGKLAPNIIVATDGAGNTFLNFTGVNGGDANGHIMLAGAGITSLAGLANSVQVNELGTPYTAPTLNSNVTINPVFINSVQPDAFGSLVHSFLPLTYTSFGSVPTGIDISPDGTLTVNVTGPVYGFLDIKVSDGIGAPISLPPTLVMAINASDGLIHQDTSSANVTDAQAFSTSTPGSTIIGGGADINYNASSTPSQNVVYGSKLIYDVSYTPGTMGHTVYGDVQNISFFNYVGGSGTSGQSLTFSDNIINTTGTIYGNVATLTMTGVLGINQLTHNTFAFGSDVLIGGVGPNNFYGDVDIFGNSNTPASYGLRGFYSGVSTFYSKDPTTGEKFLTIQDGNSGGNGANYSFTILENNAATPEAALQGDNTIPNFTALDHLNFTLPSSIYNQPAGGSPLTPTGFVNSLTITQDASSATLTFPGGGSLILDRFGTATYATPQALTTALAARITVSLADPTSNQITWGNDTYIGGTGDNTYNFTIVGTNAVVDANGTVTVPSKAVMQGYDTIQNFTASDSLNFSLAYSIYNQLAGGRTLTATGTHTLTPADFIAGLTITQNADAAILAFLGGGSLTLNGFGTTTYATLQALTTALVADVTVSLADPITATGSSFMPTNNVIVLGNIDFNQILPQYVNYGHSLSLSFHASPFGGISGITEDASGRLNYGFNTGILTTTANSLTASDPHTSLTVNFSAPVRVLALDAPVTYASGNQQGSSFSDPYGVNPHVFIGQGYSTITGGISSIVFTQVQDPTHGTRTISWQPKLIYDGTGLPDTVYGDGQSIFITNTGGLTLSTGGNYIEASGTLYGNFNRLSMTLFNGAAPSNNTFTFGSDTIQGGSGNDAFFGHLQVFGNSNNPTSYGSQNFYNGVRVLPFSTDPNTGERVLTIQDGNNNQITWGNNTYKGGGGSDTYNFTIVGTKPVDANGNAVDPQAIMQGFDTIQDFTTADRLNFNLSYAVYDQLVRDNLASGNTLTLTGNHTLTSAQFVSSLLILQDRDSAILEFPYIGSLTLDGFGTNTYPSSGGTASTALINALTATINVSLADPITAVANAPAPANNIIILGQTDIHNTIASQFNYGHTISLSFGGITGITVDTSGNIDYGTNTGLIDFTTTPLTAANFTAKDAYTSVPTHFNAPTHIVALDAPVIIDQDVGPVTGSTAASIIIGHGSSIMGGGADVSKVVTANPLLGRVAIENTTTEYDNIVIYNDVPAGTEAVTGHVQNMTFTARGNTGNLDQRTSFDAAIQTNVVDLAKVWSFSNAASSTYGNAQNVAFNAVGGVNIYSLTSSIRDLQSVLHNTVSSAGNTILTSGDAFGFAQNISLTATNGFYGSFAYNGSQQIANIAQNTITAGGNTLTGSGSFDIDLYGNAQTLSLTVNSPVNSNGTLAASSQFMNSVGGTGSPINEGRSSIQGNTFTWGANTLTGGDMDSSLYTGIARIVTANNEQAVTNVTQRADSSISNNHIIFGDSISTGMGGITAFYGDVDDLTLTNFDKYDVNVLSTPSGHVQITDREGTGNAEIVSDNTILFGNGVMNASSDGVNIFNINLFSSTDGGIVGEGHTVINNFGASGASSLLNLQLSKALYEDISNANPGATVVTPSMVDAYLAAHNGTVGVAGNGTDTVIGFNGMDGSSYGSITLVGVQANSLSAFGSDLAITANGTMHIESYNNTPTYNVALQGDSIDDLTQQVDIAHVSQASGPIIDMSGNLVLHMSNALFTSLGLSNSNTNAQNAQILENGATTATGGIAITTNTTGGVTDTILTFESTVSGSLNSYGSLTLHNTVFTVNDPLSAHLTVIHH